MWYDIIFMLTSTYGTLTFNPGMFLYAQLVLTNLISQTSKYDFKQEMKAETFPDGLEQA